MKAHSSTPGRASTVSDRVSGSTRGWTSGSRQPVFHREVLDVLEVARVVRYQHGTVCQRDSGNERVDFPGGFADRAEMRSQRAVLVGCRLIETNDLDALKEIVERRARFSVGRVDAFAP